MKRKKHFDLVEALDNSRFIKVAEILFFAKELNYNDRVYFSFLVQHWEYWITKDIHDGDGYVFCTWRTVFNWTGLQRQRQTESLRRIKELGLIDVKRKGAPARNYYKPNIKVIVSYFRHIRMQKAMEKRTREPQMTGFRSSRCPDSGHLDKRYNIKTKLKDKSFNLGSNKFDRQKHLNIIATVKEEKVIKYWNDKGKPFVTHSIGVGTKTEKRLRKEVSKRFDRGDKLSDFKFAIDSWHDLLLSGGLKISFKSKFTQSCTMLDFIAPDEFVRKVLRKAGIKIKTPYDESKKGLPTLFKTFLKEDKYPETTEIIGNYFSEAFPYAISFERDFQKAAQIWNEEFAPKYELRGKISVLKNVLNKINARTSSILTYDRFWSNTVAGILKEDGFIQ